MGAYALIETARMAATVVALPGQITFAGDKLAQLSPERMWILQRAFPACDGRPLDLFPIYDMRPVWTLKVRRAWAAWDVVSVFNFSETKPRRATVRMAELGLDAKAGYLAWDFWRQAFLGRQQGKMTLSLAPRSNALIALHPDLGRPQFLSTDRHITQGAVGLDALAWDEAALTLAGRSELVAGDPTRLAFFAPKGYALAQAACKPGKVESVDKRQDGSIVATLRAGKTCAVQWKLRFRKA